jgi:formate C-acetyltransferase
MLLFSLGHMSPDYKRVLSLGLSGILDEVKRTALKKKTELSLEFSKNAETVVLAVKDFCERYATEAEKQGKIDMAKALRTVPYAPAYDFYSALQSVWMIHFIASCIVGARDYAFGHFDAVMLPYYEKALEDGATKEELTELLAGFFMKTNEICGRATHNYKLKPTLCQSSKQYINIGGEDTNEFSHVILDAALINNMAEPTITVLLDP